MNNGNQNFFLLLAAIASTLGQKHLYNLFTTTIHDCNISRYFLKKIYSIKLLQQQQLQQQQQQQQQQRTLITNHQSLL
ncbi:hypothetical protein DERF_004064 [Dermatophagoides farinae]|uniref:Secreted protein n=1 Tax=Dermatophagoides farinae TaxID=6954 RepID=A0A922LDS1_DERFA|nr:hypothetical protein DERF_004064 [Dermatophagoides farinae]